MAGRMANISMASKIMPSFNTQKNMLKMDFRQDAIDATDNSEYDHGYFYWNKTEHYFSTLRLDPAYVPVGNSKTTCWHTMWIKKKMSNMIDMYESVQGFPKCVNAYNTKFRW